MRSKAAYPAIADILCVAEAQEYFSGGISKEAQGEIPDPQRRLHSLLHRTRRRPKHKIRITGDQADRSSHDHHNDCQRHSILSNILSLVIGPKLREKGEGHVCTNLHEMPLFLCKEAG
jgi:hypothetical protein